MKTRTIAGILIIIAFCAGCISTGIANEQLHAIAVWQENPLPNYGYMTLYKVAIPEDNVTCYVLIGSKEAMECLKKDTK
jgi:hypothetical protein